MWDGHGCPCETFDLDRDDLPTDGVFTIDMPDRPVGVGREEPSDG